MLDIEVAERESNYTPDMDGENAPPFIELLPGEVEIPSEGGQVRVGRIKYHVGGGLIPSSYGTWKIPRTGSESKAN